jgi:DNA-directed RNA polymerase specialized sigma24 family protein
MESGEPRRWGSAFSETGFRDLNLNEALTQLARLDERQAKVVELRFLAGMNEEETANALGISSRTVKRDWRIVLLHKLKTLQPQNRVLLRSKKARRTKSDSFFSLHTA